jgi:antitoxin HigA-1
MICVSTNRTPTYPGEMLLEEFLIPMGLTQLELANTVQSCTLATTKTLSAIG